MRFTHISPILAGIILLGLASGSFSAWHCGDIDLNETPRRFLIDPITGDLFVATDNACLVRIDEATYQIATLDIAGPASALAIDPMFSIPATARSP